MYSVSPLINRNVGVRCSVIGEVCVYRVIQKERSVFWEVIIWVVVRKEVRLNMCLMMNDYRNRALKIYKCKSILNGKREREFIANGILILI